MADPGRRVTRRAVQEGRATPEEIAQIQASFQEIAPRGGRGSLSRSGGRAATEQVAGESLSTREVQGSGGRGSRTPITNGGGEDTGADGRGEVPQTGGGASNGSPKRGLEDGTKIQVSPKDKGRGP